MLSRVKLLLLFSHLSVTERSADGRASPFLTLTQACLAPPSFGMACYPVDGGRRRLQRR